MLHQNFVEFSCVIISLLNLQLVAQSSLTFREPMDRSPPGSSVLEFSRQEYWNEYPFFSPGSLPNPGIESWYTTLQTNYVPFESLGTKSPKELL